MRDDSDEATQQYAEYSVNLGSTAQHITHARPPSLARLYIPSASACHSLYSRILRVLTVKLQNNFVIRLHTSDQVDLLAFNSTSSGSPFL